MARFRQAAGLLGFGVILTELLIALVSAEGTAPPLGAYNADIRESSISGISFGAFMAVQSGCRGHPSLKE
jgi:hypothetical protein